MSTLSSTSRLLFLTTTPRRAADFLLLRQLHTTTVTRMLDDSSPPSSSSSPPTESNSQGGDVPPHQFRPRKVLLLNKLSRYEFEKRRRADLSEEQLAKQLAERGSDYQGLIYHHNIHSQSKETVIKTLQENGMQTRVVQRFNLNKELLNWCDLVLAVGGDGTFLLAASRVPNCGKPVIGINSDPSRSEGYLCLPKKYSQNFPEAVHKLLHGQFSWRWRQRIRITLYGEQAHERPIELHDQQLLYPEYRYMDCLQEQPEMNGPPPSNKDHGRLLPVLALNEVFVGESLSSRVSYYEIKIDNGPWCKQKSSGVTICTGTGSSSWTFNINKLTPQCVENLLKIVKDETKADFNSESQDLIQKVTTRFNDSLLFDASECKMAYTIRDPVMSTALDSCGFMKPRGFAKRIEIKSRCFDACLVIDGGLSFMFNDGARAVFEIHESDGLRTVQLDED